MDYFEQLEALSAQQGGYFYPWASVLGAGDGEGAYTALVEANLTPDTVVLDAGCGHGEDMLRFAPRVRRFLGYDAVESFVAIARRRAAEAGLANVELTRANSSARFNGGAVRIPAADGELDLIVSRRGPSNWIADARRVCRPGARLIQLNPLPAPTPAWNAALPAALQLADNPANPGRPQLAAEIEAALAAVDLVFERAEVIDVAETFESAQDLYRYLTFMRFEPDAPTWDEARAPLERLLAKGPAATRQRRLLWSAVVG